MNRDSFDGVDKQKNTIPEDPPEVSPSPPPEPDSEPSPPPEPSSDPPKKDD